MSLKFGIYLVEQRIISPEQFCGLVKIQQETTISLANIAIRKNILTIKQVAEVLDDLETSPDKTFEQIAMEKDFLDKADVMQLIQFQAQSCTPIRRLVSECGLLTERQASVLYHHFERNPTTLGHPDASATPTPVGAPAFTKTHQKRSPAATSVPPRPKFRSRPVIVHPYSTNS